MLQLTKKDMEKLYKIGLYKIVNDLSEYMAEYWGEGDAEYYYTELDAAFACLEKEYE
jgi:hypothetical protein